MHDLEKENRELRQSQLSMREEIRRLTEIQQGMQDMFMRSQSSQRSSPIAKQQYIAQTSPVPSPRTIYMESERPVPKPATRAHPVPAPRRIPTPKSRVQTLLVQTVMTIMLLLQFNISTMTLFLLVE